MTYENLVKAAKKAVNAVDPSVIKEHLAVEFDIEGKGEGAFYVEFKEKAVDLEPYEYYDHDFRVRGEADTILAILKGELSPVQANNDGAIKVEGDAGKLLLLTNYLKAEVKEKKTTKSSTKAPAKTAAKTTAKTAAKPAAKKPAAKKPVPKKVAKKPAASK